MFLKICRNYLFVLIVVLVIFIITPDVFGQGNDTCDMNHESTNTGPKVITKQQIDIIVNSVNTDMCISDGIKLLVQTVLASKNNIYIGRMHKRTLGINTRSTIMLFDLIVNNKIMGYSLRVIIEFDDKGTIKLIWNKKCE